MGNGSGYNEDIRAAAIRWFMRNGDPDISAGEKAAFARWIAAAPEHRHIYDRLVSLWHSDSFAQAVQNAAPPEVTQPAPSGQKRGRVYQAAGLAVAACLGLFVAFSDAGLQLGNKMRALTVDYATETGERKTVSLQDGARVTLNTASFMDVETAAAGDRITLLSGEAFFEVPPDRSERFFDVATDQAEIRILGTAFSVRNTGSETVVGVRKGKVSVMPRSGAGTAISLAAGEQVSVNANGFGRIVALQQESPAWLEGRIHFHATPLGEVVAELQRYHKGLILFADADLKNQIVSGNYKLDSPVIAVTSLASSVSAEAVRVTDRLLILK